MKLPVTNIIKETDQAVTVCFKNNSFFKKIKYKPGQFFTLKVPVNSRVENRAYSFSSNPYTDKELKVTVKKVEGGLVSNYINDELKIGDRIEVGRAMGSFYIEPNKKTKKQYILFAAGSGITPVYSILKSVLLKEPLSNVLLIYANQDIDNIIFFKELQELAIKFEERFSIDHILSQNSNPNFHSGFLTKDIVQKIFAKNKIAFLDEHQYMICGPSGYMKKVKEVLKAKFIKPSRIQVEAFKASTIKIDSKNLLSNVTIKHNGTTHQLKVPGNKSILQKAMSENIVLPYSCRSGMCSTCKANCTQGEITMTDGHFLDEKETSEGAILTCISYPASEEIVIEIPN